MRGHIFRVIEKLFLPGVAVVDNSRRDERQENANAVGALCALRHGIQT